MANQDHFRKLLIRSALVTSSTIATLVGAQTLMLLDAEEFNEASTDVSVEEPVEVEPLIGSVSAAPTQTLEQNEATQEVNPTLEDTPTVAPTETEIVIQHAAPSIVILRQSGQSSLPTPTNSHVASNNSFIQPPSPVQLAPPAPIVVEQPAPIVQQPAPIVVQQSAPVQHQSAPSSSRTRSSK